LVVCERRAVTKVYQRETLINDVAKYWRKGGSVLPDTRGSRRKGPGII